MASNNLLKQVKLICQTYDIKPIRHKGQNFLIDADALEDIVSSANLDKQDTVLEVGPGLGILTEQLVKKSKKVVSVELDKKLFNFLKLKFRGMKNLELVNEDILKFNPTNYSLQTTHYKLVANLPYNITSHFLKKFLTVAVKPTDMTLLVQKEVAQRICAPAGQMSLLSVSVQFYSQPKIVQIVSAQSFWPAPEVDSAILKLSSIKDQQAVDNFLGNVLEDKFWQIVRIGFSAKRKQLQNNLAVGLKIPGPEIKKILKKADLEPKIRAQNLSVADWLKLVKEIKF